MKHLINWIEIPVLSMERAKSFYEQILAIEITEVYIGKTLYGLFPTKDNFNAGALAHGNSYVPSKQGILIYLNGGNDLNSILEKVERSGGKIILPKTFLSEEAGFIGLFEDTEGNLLGLQNM